MSYPYYESPCWYVCPRCKQLESYYHKVCWGCKQREIELDVLGEIPAEAFIQALPR